MSVYVVFWFDVEDYVTPESDIALGRLIDIFDRHDLKAVFKMVGEKVRALERRGHRDILAKLLAHDIGYHTNYHSRPPSISEYMLGLGWQEGRDEFIRREQEGIDTLRRVFGRMPACYGQPGGAWAPQVYPALRWWGIDNYLDAGPWVDVEGKPHRYCDILCFTSLNTLTHLGIGGGAQLVAERKKHIAQAVERLRPTGGIVSLYAHECEFVTARFWDAVNFAGGKNPPREKWQPAPLVSPQESESRYAAMDDLLTFVQSLPDVQVVTITQAAALYPDRAKGRSFTPHQVAQLAASMAEAITHRQLDGAYLSPGEIFGLAVRLLAERVRTGRWPESIPYRYFDGPPRSPHVQVEAAALSLDDIFGTCLYEDVALERNDHMPAEVQVGRNWLAPADFLATIGAALPRWLQGDTGDAPLLKGNFVQEEHVLDHADWSWVIFPPGFDGDPLFELGKLQAWTLKPAPPIG